MNKVMLMGRLVREPEMRMANDNLAVCRYTLAVDRRMSKDENADFISCVAFGKAAEFANKYFTKGLRVLVTGRLQTGSYDHKDGYKVYTTDVIIEDQEFADGKSESSKEVEETKAPAKKTTKKKEDKKEDFVVIADEIEDDEVDEDFDVFA